MGGSPAHRCPRGRCGRSPAPPRSCSGNSRRHWRRIPSRSHNAARASGRKLYARAGAILLVKVPATIITSDWRGEARGAKPQPLQIIARHRGLHHLDRAAGETEGHPHQGSGARPIDQALGTGDQEALVGHLLLERLEARATSVTWAPPSTPARPAKPAGTGEVITPIRALPSSIHRWVFHRQDPEEDHQDQRETPVAPSEMAIQETGNASSGSNNDNRSTR